MTDATQGDGRVHRVGAHLLVGLLLLILVLVSGLLHLRDVEALGAAAAGDEAIAALHRRSLLTGGAVMAGTILIVLLAASLFARMRREMARRLAAEADLQRANRDLEAAVATRTADLRREVTARQAATDSLSAVIDQVPIGIVGIDAKGIVTIWNRAAAALFGYPAEEVLGHPDPVLHLGPLAAPGSADPTEQRIQRKSRDGRPLELSVSLARVRGPEGEPVTTLAAIEDFTQRNAVEHQLRQAQKMEAVGQLTGGLAHDFNNLLTVIIGNLDLLEEAVEGTPEADLVRTALSASTRGADLTRQLLAFSRRQPLNTSVVEVTALVRGMTDILARTLGEWIRIDVQLSRGIWRIRCDPAQLESAIVNLAINARDAMAGGGRLSIEARNATIDARLAEQYPGLKVGDYVVLAVSDTGGGIPPDVLEKVFEPFFTTKREGKGSGLGLSMVYGFMRQIGGHVTIYSEVGHGTTVRLYLPRADALAPDVARPAEPAEPRAPTGETVLVVEDQEGVRQTVIRQLGELGYRVAEAADPEAALAVLRGPGPVDLLFTDVILPGGTTGIDLIHRARSLRPHLKVLLTSGFTEAALRNNGMAPEAAGLLSKPYRKRELAAAVHAAVTGAPPPEAG